MTRRNPFGSMGAVGVAVLSAGAQAEDARLGPMADVLMNRVGRWNVEMRLDPGQGRGAIVSKAIETNHLVGGKWLVSELSGEMNGRPFTGLGLTAMITPAANMSAPGATAIRPLFSRWREHTMLSRAASPRYPTKSPACG